MSARIKPVTLHILDKEYVVACPESECGNLLASADYLTRKMKEVRESGKLVGTERLLVMAALNVVHELLGYKQQKEHYNEDIGSELKRLENKIEFALNPAKVVT